MQDINPYFINSADESLSTLGTRTQEEGTRKGKSGIIISGAFTDAMSERARDAVDAFASAIYDRGGVIIFGGHPTFQQTIFQLARERRPDDYREATHLYVSRSFIDDETAERFRSEAKTVVTESVGDDQDRSLTAMRTAMIADSEAAALVAIGGKEATEDHSPGVDEEVALARASGLPVFLIGSAGGRTATLAAQYQANGWQPSLNELSAEDNEKLFVSQDYGMLAHMVLAAVGL